IECLRWRLALIPGNTNDGCASSERSWGILLTDDNDGEFWYPRPRLSAGPGGDVMLAAAGGVRRRAHAWSPRSAGSSAALHRTPAAPGHYHSAARRAPCLLNVP